MKMSYLFVNCKWFCLEVLLKELVVSKNERTICTKTYKCHNLIDQEIMNKHSYYIKNNLNLSLDEANKCLLGIAYAP